MSKDKDMTAKNKHDSASELCDASCYAVFQLLKRGKLPISFDDDLLIQEGDGWLLGSFDGRMFSENGGGWRQEMTHDVRWIRLSVPLAH